MQEANLRARRYQPCVREAQVPNPGRWPRTRSTCCAIISARRKRRADFRSARTLAWPACSLGDWAGRNITGDLYSAINAGVADGYVEGYLRKSVVADPLRRVNTENNPPRS